jgi:hypothetical protein
MVQVLTTSFKGRIFATGRRPHLAASAQDATALKKKKSVCRMLPRKDGSRRRGHEGEREGQDLNNRTCCHNVELCIRAQTFMLRKRPIPLCAWAARDARRIACGTSLKRCFSPATSLRFLCAHASSCYCNLLCSHMSACGMDRCASRQRASCDLTSACKFM